MGLRTVLHDWHVSHGARMVDFAGWDMPVQYSSIIEEHTAVRTAAGVFDISHMGRLLFTGPDALALIQKVYTNNAATLKDGQVRYGLVCNDRGGIRDDVLVYRWPQEYGMVVNASNREKILAWLAESRGNLKVEVRDQTRETCMVAVQGPRAMEMCRGLTEVDAGRLSYYHAASSRYQGQPCIVSRTGYTGEDGLEFVVAAGQGAQLWEELLRRGCKPCGLGARDTLRLEAAMPLYGHELGEDIDPFQAGLSWAVKLDKGDFRGRDALLRRRQDITLPRRIGLELEGKRIAREGAGVSVGGRSAGTVTSGTFGPSLNKSIAMAYLDPARQQPGTPCVVDIRGKEEPARIVSLPFYQRPR
jgi:aminomethyltransferase